VNDEAVVGSDAFRLPARFASLDPRFDRRMLPVLEIQVVGEAKCIDIDRRARLVGVSSVEIGEPLFFVSGLSSVILLPD
jgi:hypothetical protein